MQPFTLVHLSGSERGATWPLFGRTIRVVAGPHGLTPYAAGVHPGAGDLLLTIRRARDGHEITEAPGRPVWVAGARARVRSAVSGDLIEVGDGGPILRYRRAIDSAGHKSVVQAWQDVFGFARVGGSGVVDRCGLLLLAPIVEIATQVRPAARLLCLLGALTAGLAFAYWRSAPPPFPRVDGGVSDSVDEMLLQHEPASFTRADYDRARAELDFRIDDTLTRLESLEDDAEDWTQVLASSAGTVALLQGSYGFDDADSGLPVHLPTRGNSPRDSTSLHPGSELRLLFVGTAFLAGDDGLLVTNRRVVAPWEADARARALMAKGYTPVLRRLVGYLPGAPTPFEISPLPPRADAGLALLRCPRGGCRVAGSTIPGLRLAGRAPRTGEEVVVLTYPRTMRTLLARAGAEFAELETGPGKIGFWDLGARLAASRRLAPLAVSGRIERVGSASILYPTETSHATAGGPVLATDGTVVAVSTATDSSPDGSAPGIPIELAVGLIQRLPDSR